MKRLALFVPLAIFLVLSIFFYRGLSLNPSDLPSALIDKSFPVFSLPKLHDQEQLSHRDEILGEYTLVNIWATWCVACKVEHPFLNELSQAGVRIVGVNWKDDPTAARKLLEKEGNPYQWSIMDREGKLSFDLGVYGAPETFLVDPEGVIRYKHVGILDAQIWEEKFKPMMMKDEV